MKKVEQLGKELAKARKANNHSQYQLAKELGVKIDTIKSIEATGKGNICTLFKIVSYYGLEVSIIQKTVS